MLAAMKSLCIASCCVVLAAASYAEDYSKWRCYRALQFDTTPAGANVSGDVRDFPLAVALSAANFDFATAKPDGSDLRFTNDKDDPPLPHAIEHWDAAAKSALVWVRVPRVRGNRNDQAIFMHWQNPEAASVARPAEVFDTKDGFLGVWHLDDEGGRRAARTLLASGPAPDGVYALTSNHALGVVAVLAEHGLRVPADVRIVAGSDAESLRAAHPTISSIDLQPDELARRAVEVLAARLDDRPLPDHGEQRVGRLVVRASSTPPGPQP